MLKKNKYDSYHGRLRFVDSEMSPFFCLNEIILAN